jgi:hypothetical protein
MSNYISELDNICNYISDIHLMTEYDSLLEANYTISEIEDRYKRYINSIKIWYINDMNCEFIRNKIILWLDTKTTCNNIKYKINLAKEIDNEIKIMLN